MRRELDSMQSTSVQPAVVDDSELRSELQAKNSDIESLRGEVERLNAALSSSGDASPAQLAAEQRVQELTAENDQLRSQLEQVRSDFDRERSERVTQAVGGSETLTVTSSAEAAPAVTRLLQMATDQATTLVNEAQAEAQRKIAEAENRAAEIKTDARTKAERVESEARVNAEQMTNEADARAADVDRQADQRRHELFGALEREQGELSGKVDALRSFESSYRQNLGGSLQRFLNALNEDHPEPGDVPELAQQSETPRLDSLAHGDQG